MIVGHNGDARALQKWLDEIASAGQQTDTNFDVIAAGVKRDPNGLMRLVGGFLVHSLCLRESGGVCLGGVRFLLPVLLNMCPQ
jgi:hypothetical protein